MKHTVEIKTNDAKLLEMVDELAPDVALIISHLAHLNMRADYLTDVIVAIYKISSGTGNGKISIVVEEGRIRSIHGIENRWVDKDIFNN